MSLCSSEDRSVRAPIPKNNSFEDEELDFEDDFDSKHAAAVKSDDEEEGEIVDDDEDVKNNSKAPNDSKVQPLSDKDEGEIDDEELEEGEVKEDNEPKVVPNRRDSVDERYSGKPFDARINIRGRDNQASYTSRVPNHYQYYSDSNRSRNNRYYSDRPRDASSFQPAPSTVETAWERGLKQARELITKASKRKEGDIENENARSKPPSECVSDVPPDNDYGRSIGKPSPKRIKTSNSSSEDEVERRHRLAYDAAPWNTSSIDREGYYRSDSYRDPWRRSNSPRNRRVDYSLRVSDSSRRELPSLLKRTDSISSISSDDSGSTGRKLPYSRPKARNRPKESPNPEEVRSRLGRIPKKTNASARYESNADFDTKSYDSWSESLSSDSSFIDSDDSNGSRKEMSVKEKRPLIERNQSRNTKSKQIGSSSSKSPSNERGPQTKLSRYEMEREAKQSAPVRMTFLKTAKNSLNKGKLMDDVLNGDLDEISDKNDDINSPESKFEKDSDPDEPDPSSREASEREEKREKILRKLKAVEEAIARKLRN